MRRLQVLLSETLVRELQKHFAVAAQRGASEPIERNGQPLLSTIECAVALELQRLLRLEACARILELAAELLLHARGAQRHDQPAENEPDQRCESKPDPKGVCAHDREVAPLSQSMSCAGS